MRLESGFHIVPNWLYIYKIAMASQFSDMTSSSIIFDLILFFFSSLVTGQFPLVKFHINIITGSGVITIFFYNGLTRNLGIGNTTV